MPEPVSRRLPQSWRRPVLHGAAIVAGWTLIALIWTPPSILVARSQHQPADWHGIFAQVFLSFVPWMLATPVLLRLGRRFPIAEGGIGRNLAIHAGLGIALVPVLALGGMTLVALFLPLPRNTTLSGLIGGAMITGLYSVPTYVAVTGIAQALAYLERYRQRERLLARAQLQALQAQIRPHFLFNALNAISALGYKDATRADRALSQLSALLRLSLKDGPHEVPLKEEIAFVQGCIDIYGLLLPERFDWELDIDADAWNAPVPRMILQPLVENAVVHGIARRKQGGAILLSARAEGGALTVCLENDAADEPADTHGGGIGLSNVRERLRMLYGRAQTLDFVSGREGRTRVTMTLPYAPGGREE